MNTGYDLLIDNFERHIKLSSLEIEYINSTFEYLTFKKKEIVQPLKKPCEYIYFVTNGCLKTYHIDIYSREHVVHFQPNDWWATDLYSFFNETPSSLVIAAITETVTLRISKSSYDELLIKYPKFEHFFRKLFQKALFRHNNKAIMVLTLNAKERYLNFIKTFPNILQDASLKDIASYLGITPEFLSRMRKKMLNK